MCGFEKHNVWGDIFLNNFELGSPSLFCNLVSFDVITKVAPVTSVFIVEINAVSKTIILLYKRASNT